VRDPLEGHRAAQVYRRGQFRIVAAECRAGYGPSFSHSPYRKVESEASDEVLGAAVVAAIDGHTLMEVPPSPEAQWMEQEALFQVVGVKDRRSFDRGASYIHVEERTGTWSVQPWGRERGYWTPLNEHTWIEIHDPDPNQVGAAVRVALSTLKGGVQ